MKKVSKCHGVKVSWARKIAAAILVVFLSLNLAGCETVRKKFTRKKKPTVKMPRIYQVRKYNIKPTSELYQKHYAYWESWQSELIKVLGESHKKDVLCIEQIISNLNDMRNILVQEKADRLKPHIEKLARVKDVIVKEELTQFNRTYVMTTLEREERAIRREFILSKVKDNIRTEFENEDEAGQ